MKQNNTASSGSGKVNTKPSFDQVTISNQAAALLRSRITAQQAENLSKAEYEPNVLMTHDKNNEQ